MVLRLAPRFKGASGSINRALIALTLKPPGAVLAAPGHGAFVVFLASIRRARATKPLRSEAAVIQPALAVRAIGVRGAVSRHARIHPVRTSAAHPGAAIRIRTAPVIVTARVKQPLRAHAAVAVRVTLATQPVALLHHVHLGRVVTLPRVRPTLPASLQRCPPRLRPYRPRLRSHCRRGIRARRNHRHRTPSSLPGRTRWSS